MKPIREKYTNPMAKPSGSGDIFTHFEIVSVREYQSPDGAPFVELCFKDEDMEEDHPSGMATGLPIVGVFGRLSAEGVEHITDFQNVEDARRFLRRIGVSL